MVIDMEKLRVIEVIPSLKIRAGAEVFFVNLCNQISKNQNVTLSIVVLYDGLHDSYKEILKIPNVKIYFCHKRKGVDFKAAKYFKKIINENKPDIVHTHLNCILTYFLAFGINKQSFKLFHTVHSVLHRDNHSVHTIRSCLIKFKRLRLISIAPNITKEIKKKYSKLELLTVYNGIPLFEKKQSIDIKYDFICIASLTPVKNHKFLIDAFNEFFIRHPDSKLALVGGGPLFDEIKKYVEKLPSSQNIEFVGPVSNVQQYLEQSRIFTLSSFFEGNPISVLEAMSVGLPVVLPNVGGIPNVVVHGRNGLLFESGDKTKMIQYFEKLTIDQNLYNKMVQNNINDVKKYSIKKCANEYLKIFNQYK